LYTDAVYSDEAAFHLCGKVNKHNCCIWNYKKPQYEKETITDCTVGPSSYHKATVTRNMYMDTIKSFAVDQIPSGATLQHDGAPPHYNRQLHTFLNLTFPGWLTGRGQPITWPSRGLNLVSLDFFLCRFKDRDRENGADILLFYQNSLNFTCYCMLLIFVYASIFKTTSFQVHLLELSRFGML
jgi:hypothetical protein